MVRSIQEEELSTIASEILHEYENKQGPFAQHILPERQVIDNIHGEQDRALFLTFSVTLDYQMSADRLWQTMDQLWKAQRWIFEPDKLLNRPQEDLASLFQEKGVRFPNDGARYWYENARTIKRDFNSNVLELIEENESNALQIKRYVQYERPNDFYAIKGRKVNSLWLRLIHEDVQELEDIEQVPIPPDVHIIRMTNYLLGTTYSEESDEDREAVQEVWQRVCNNNGLVPIRLDQPLWLIDSHWDDWGERYLHSYISE